MLEDPVPKSLLLLLMNAHSTWGDFCYWQGGSMRNSITFQLAEKEPEEWLHCPLHLPKEGRVHAFSMVHVDRTCGNGSKLHERSSDQMLGKISCQGTQRAVWCYCEIEKHLKDNIVIGCSQHRFMSGKSCLANLLNLLLWQGYPSIWLSEGRWCNHVGFQQCAILFLTVSFWTICPAYS